MNYSDPEGDKAVIALVKWPSTLPTDSPSYRGPILFNPGGPGGSGVDLILTGGPTYAEILGPQFDLVGFDPRGTFSNLFYSSACSDVYVELKGIGESTPTVSFFESQAERVQWTPPIKLLDASVDAIPLALGRAQITNKLAKQRDNNTLAHINTDQTARDMLSIVQAHGREKLQYYAVSYVSSAFFVCRYSYTISHRYGTVLGATFAAMFPVSLTHYRRCIFGSRAVL